MPEGVTLKGALGVHSVVASTLLKCLPSGQSRKVTASADRLGRRHRPVPTAKMDRFFLSLVFSLMYLIASVHASRRHWTSYNSETQHALRHHRGEYTVLSPALCVVPLRLTKEHFTF